MRPEDEHKSYISIRNAHSPGWEEGIHWPIGHWISSLTHVNLAVVDGLQTTKSFLEDFGREGSAWMHSHTAWGRRWLPGVWMKLFPGVVPTHLPT